MGTSQNSRLALRKVFEGNVAARVLSGRDDLFGSLVGNFKEPYYSPARRNTDTKLLIYGLFQKGRVLAQDGDQPAVYMKGHVDLRRRTRRVRGRRLPLPAAFASSGACRRSYKAKRYSTRSRSDVKRARR